MQPFKEAFPHNPAWEITRRLPEYLPPAPAKSVLHKRRPDTPLLPAVRIQRFAEPVRVNYQVVRSLVPVLWGDKRLPPDSDGVGDGTGRTEENEKAYGDPAPKAPKIDVMLHIGMAGPRPYYSIERRGHRDDYLMRDVDGELLNDVDQHKRLGDNWIWHGLPHEIKTDLGLDEVLDRWRGYSPWDADLRISEDAGHYLCDFIYYSSLAHLFRKEERRRVVFLHVPADCSEDGVLKGVNLTIQLIRSMCESELNSRKRQEGEGGKKGSAIEDL